MGRRAARLTHIGLSILGLVLFAVFVIPRWWVLLGDIPATLAAVGRIATGFPIAAAAVPVALVLQRSIKGGGAVPELALRLRAWSGVLHIVAGVLIVLTAVAEIWLTAPGAAPWLFAVYGAAAAIAILAVLAFVLSFVAEKPPAPPKPAKAKKVKPTKEKRRGRGKNAVVTDTETADADGTDVADVVETDAAEADSTDVEADAEPVEETLVDETVVADEEVVVGETVVEAPADEPKPPVETVEDESPGDESPDADALEAEPVETTTGLQNKRPTGKRRHRLRR